MRKKCLYLGNALTKHGNTPTSVETVGEQLKESLYIELGSGYHNKTLRILHMWFLILRYRKHKNVLIDTYSTSSFWFAITCSFLCKFLGLNYIPILHGGNLKIRTTISPRIYFSYLRSAYKVVCPSDFTMETMKVFCQREYSVIPNSIQIKNYKFIYRKPKQMGLRLLWVRSFHSMYNPLLAIQVLHELRSKGFQVSLTMVGPDKDGSLELCLESARQRNISDFVNFTGLMRPCDWHELATEQTFFINTTHIDNTPVSLIESMALGLPIISTNVGGIPYLIEDGVSGILVQPDNSTQFADAIESLFENEELYMQIAKNARQKAELFDWEIVKKQWIDILE